MTDAKFTSGPWRVGYEDGSGNDPYEDYYVITKGGDEMIVDGSSGDTYECKSWCLGVLRHQDAHLIAAAPDLYEALMEVVTISDRNHKAWDRARDALAKARGEHDTDSV